MNEIAFRELVYNPLGDNSNHIGCSAPARRRSLLVSVKWLIEFRLQDGRLVEIAVDEGLTGL